MTIHTHIASVQAALTDTFAALDTWCDAPAALQHYRPADGGWTANEILEHTALTNHFLLLLIRKGARKALQQAPTADLSAELAAYTFQEEKLAEVGVLNSFAWIRPEHMVPTGTRPLPEVRQQLRQQVTECLQLLADLKNGEGVLYKTTMSVNGLGKITVYEYLYFLAQHGRRHLMQLAENETEFLQQHQ
ncbi:DinB family protein [Hymenobacter pini]|uniref:DinB family protein n=1 Tax=Hymenobacter pini TaxID=2880879 RepID=UPI001CF5C7B8|nr:DinB family protein [Hymenobacter pini]MCA8829738.1 DinB family protein [Hymenobacter pini]